MSRAGWDCWLFSSAGPLEMAVCRREPDAFVPVWEPRGNADRRCGNPLALLPQFKRLKERKARITVLVLCAALVAALWGSGLFWSRWLCAR